MFNNNKANHFKSASIVSFPVAVGVSPRGILPFSSLSSCSFATFGSSGEARLSWYASHQLYTWGVVGNLMSTVETIFPPQFSKAQVKESDWKFVIRVYLALHTLRFRLLFSPRGVMACRTFTCRVVKWAVTSYISRLRAQNCLGLKEIHFLLLLFVVAQSCLLRSERIYFLSTSQSLNHKPLGRWCSHLVQFYRLSC